MLVVACAEVGHDVAADGFVPQHQKAGWVASHLKHSCLKLQTKHFLPYEISSKSLLERAGTIVY